MLRINSAAVEKNVCTLALASVFALWATSSEAGLISTINVDTITNLDVSWTWNPEEADTDTPGLTNWTVELGIAGPAGVPLSWSVSLDVHHVTDPHPGETGGDLVNFSFTFRDADEFGLIYDQNKTGHHPPSHRDEYHFTFDRSGDPANTVIRLTGRHVPEPSTILLLGAGAFAMFGRRRPRLAPA